MGRLVGADWRSPRGRGDQPIGSLV
jgi:hypothetical protein